MTIAHGPRPTVSRLHGLPGRRRLVLLRLCLLLPALCLPALLAPGPARAEPAAGAHPPGSPVLMAGHFRLQDTSGRTLDSDALADRPYGLFFGFTHCPDLCPTTLAQLSLALRPIADPDLRIYFVTVDPERDTPALLADYMQGFDPRIVALTGERRAVEEATASFGIVAERVGLPDGRYTYGHTGTVMRVDENGLIVDRFAAEADVPALTARLVPLARAATAR